jgi:hypothetical protein
MATMAELDSLLKGFGLNDSTILTIKSAIGSHFHSTTLWLICRNQIGEENTKTLFTFLEENDILLVK